MKLNLKNGQIEQNRPSHQNLQVYCYQNKPIYDLETNAISRLGLEIQKDCE